MLKRLCFFLIYFLSLNTSSVIARDIQKTFYLYHDADWVNHIESAESIWRGVSVALAEIDYQVQGYQLELVKKNHSGNVARSKANIEAFINDPHALAVIGGLHSPPLIVNRDLINQNQVLTLVPWAAAGPITRYPSSDNWVFRLSVDDTKAGSTLVSYALDQKRCKAPHLLLESTPWGDSNLKSMSAALAQYPDIGFEVSRFGWGIKKYAASDIISTILESSADCILFVGNAVEGSGFISTIARLSEIKHVPVISHWGITGGNFHEVVDKNIREKVDLSFIQSCFSFMKKPLSNQALDVFTKSKSLFPQNIRTVSDIRSPVGFIHGYDITKLFIAALNQVELSYDVVKNRKLIKRALENLEGSIEGLVKTYHNPYSVFTTTNMDAHEALGKEDYCMAYYNDNNDIVVLPKP